MDYFSLNKTYSKVSNKKLFKSEKFPSNSIKFSIIWLKKQRRTLSLNILTTNNVPFNLFLVCETHRLATRIWRGITDHTEKHELCPCCNRKVGNIEVETQCKPHSSEFSFLGVGIPLFFKFIKYSIAILITLTLVFSIYALHTNVSSNNCT